MNRMRLWPHLYAVATGNVSISEPEGAMVRRQGQGERALLHLAR
jgi:hypothetical protein